MLRVLRCQYASFRYYAKKKTDEMKYLNVAEKHDAAKTIAGLLSNGTARRREGHSVYNKVFDFDANVLGRNCKMVMTSVSGHLLNLEFLASYRNWRNVDPQMLFEAPIRKTCSDDYAPIKRTLEREIRFCQGLIIWTDCDREGENIGQEIIDVCRAVKANIKVHRAVFSEITTTAVRRALAQLVAPDRRQSDAVDVRSELDLRTGAAITRFQTMRLQRLFPENIADKLISYGSCQIPTLGFVVERYKEAAAFVSEPFWKIKVIHTIEELTVEFIWARQRLFDKQACEDFLIICAAEPQATVESVTVKPKHKWRPQPMDTVEMEKLGSRKLKLSAKETMTIAEKLYTKGIISYPRTETNQFSKEIDLKSLVEAQTGHSAWGEFAQRVVEWGPNPRNGSKTDQAHPPIHPTKLVTNLDGNEARVYELVCRHFLACVSKDAVGSETVVHINIAGEKFTATGLCIYERNYLDVYVYEKWNAKQIHKYEQGQVFEPTDISMQEGATTAPPLLTEADLIALMEKHGIGTDATHAEHINTIKERGYIGVVDKGFLVPGVIGMGLYEGYDAMELVLAKPILRAEFEADLKKICLGEKDPQVVLRDHIQKYKAAYSQIMDKISAMDAKIALRLNETPSNSNDAGGAGADDNYENNPNRMQALFQCPKCDVAPLALKPKKNQTGHFIGCLNYPDCRNTIWLPEECREPSVLDETCSQCGGEVKLLKFKFHTAYYKTMFQTPHGWYKTCLRCDSHFRNTFDINLEAVKRVGAIVGSATTAATSSSVSSGSSSIGGTTMHGPGPSSGSRSSAGRPAPGGAAKKATKSKTTAPLGGNTTTAPRIRNPASGSTMRPPKQKPPPAKTTASSGIRSYFTTATDTRSRPPAETVAATQIAAEQLRGVPLDALFDDGFDDILLDAEAQLAASGSRALSEYEHEQLQADVAAVFADDDDIFGELSWATGEEAAVSAARSAPTTAFNNSSGIGGGVRRIATTTTNRANNDDADEGYSCGPGRRSTASVNRSMAGGGAYLEDSFGEICREYELQGGDEPYTWGSGKRNSFIGAAGSPAANAPKRTRVDAGGETWQPAAASGDVRCTGCHQPAKELTVRKEGVNKGRQFYACAKSKPCNFFQWADEVQQQQQPQQPQQAPQRAPRDGVRCNCGAMANSLIVRKEGPNHGRHFFGCPNREKSCGFFQWDDGEDVADGPSTSASAFERDLGTTSWGTGRSRGASGSGSGSGSGNFTAVKGKSRSSSAPTKRKCGLCRQEGHTKLKCPRKAEFDI